MRALSSPGLDFRGVVLRRRIRRGGRFRCFRWRRGTRRPGLASRCLRCRGRRRRGRRRAAAPGSTPEEGRDRDAQPYDCRPVANHDDLLSLEPLRGTKQCRQVIPKCNPPQPGCRIEGAGALFCRSVTIDRCVSYVGEAQFRWEGHIGDRIPFRLRRVTLNFSTHRLPACYNPRSIRRCLCEPWFGIFSC